MSYNGSGTFNINSTGQPVVAGTVITASAFNALTADLATGLTTAITKDGQTTTTAQIPFAQGLRSTLVTDSSSVSTGSIITDGGMGVAKNLYVGGTLNVTGSTSLTNPVINNIKMGYSTTATAGGSTSLTVSSNYRQFFTGTTTQTIVLPVTSTLVAGMAYEIENNSTGLLTVNSSGGNLVGTIPAGVCAHAVCIGTTLTTAADWDWDYISTTTITGTGANVLGTSPTIATPTITGDATISGLTVGKGGGAVATNTAVGVSALASNTSGDRSVAVGYQAATANTTGINTVVGYQALKTNTTGTENTAIGFLALQANTTGGYNSAIGDQTLYANTTGSNNIAVGQQALAANTTATNNTAVGYQAAYNNTIGNRVTAIGYQSLYTANRTADNDAANTAVGSASGYLLTTGQYNTFVGLGSGYYMTTGGKNTILGGYTGNQGGLDIRTASNNIVLSDGDGNPRMFYNSTYSTWYAGNSTASSYWPQQTSVSGNNCASVNGNDGTLSATGNASFLGGWNRNNGAGDFHRFYLSGSQIGSISGSGSLTTYNSTSDYRLKNVIGAVSGHGERIDALEPIEYEWKTDNSKTRGFLAHKFQEVYPTSVSGTKDAIDEKGNPKYQSMQASTSEVIADLIAEIQSLRKRLAIIEAK